MNLRTLLFRTILMSVSVSAVACVTDSGDSTSETVSAITTNVTNGTILVGSYHESDGAVILSQEFLDMAARESVQFSVPERSFSPDAVFYALGLEVDDTLDVVREGEVVGALQLRSWSFVDGLDEGTAGTLFPLDEDDLDGFCD